MKNLITGVNCVENTLCETESEMLFITGKFVFKGNLDVFARTASKYDDCRMLHLPGLKFR